MLQSWIIFEKRYPEGHGDPPFQVVSKTFKGLITERQLRYVLRSGKFKRHPFIQYRRGFYAGCTGGSHKLKLCTPWVEFNG